MAVLKINSVNDMKEILLKHGRSLESFQIGDTIQVYNKMEKHYSYTLEVAPGTNMAFKPYANPGEMLRAGVFEGKYLNDCLLEFPSEWFWDAILAGKLCPEGANDSINLFGIKSRQPLNAWIKARWLPGSSGPSRGPGPSRGSHKERILSDPKKNPDERGWFQWYCRYWMGRRIPELDEIQIGRWAAFTRHAGQIKANCASNDLECRPRQRQGLFQWAHDPFI